MANVCGLSLEAYLQLHKALTKHGHVVQSVTPIEECYYKMNDLRQLLQLHGLTAGKFNRAELLAAMKGQKLINPCSSLDSTTIAAEVVVAPGACSTVAEPAEAELPFNPAEVCAVLGISGPASTDMQCLQFIKLTHPAAVQRTAATAGAGAGLQAGTASGDHMAAQPQTADAPSGSAMQPQGTAASGDGQAANALAQAAAPVAGSVMNAATVAPASTTGAISRLPQAQRAPPPAASVPQTQHHTHTQQTQQVPAQPPAQPSVVQATAPALHRPQAAGTSSAAPVGISTQQHQQQQQQLLLQQQQAAPASSAASDPVVLPQGLVLHQLLAALLNQPAAGPATAESLPVTSVTLPQHTQAILQQSAAAVSLNGLLQQLLTSSTTPAAQNSHAGTVQQQPAVTAPTAAAGAAPPDQNSAAAVQQKSAAGTATAMHAPAALTARPDSTVLHTAGPPRQHHTPWLCDQLQWLAASGMQVSRSAAAGAGAGAGAAADACSAAGLLGCHVGFVLLEQMQVLGPRGTLLTLPAGVYEGMAVKHLGSSCQHEVCEAGCPGQHDFYRARILPPRALPDPDSSSSCGPELASNLAQAHAATSGRPVLLILDLHPRLRCHSLEQLLELPTPEQLQDAWLLLEHEQQTDSTTQPEATAAAAPAGAAAGQPQQGPKRTMKPGSCKPGSSKRSKAT